MPRTIPLSLVHTNRCHTFSLISMGTATVTARAKLPPDQQMGFDSCSSPPPASSPVAVSPCGKRGRDPEDEVYLDNLHSHKRYLSEIMASSLNGLTVGESLTENLMESGLRSETSYIPRDDISSQYSPMSEDSDDARFCDTPLNLSSAPYDSISNPTSPVSPHRHYRSTNALSSANSYPLPGCTLATVVCSHTRHRGSDSEGRFPSSPNDLCHTPDLRRAALLRSVQMRSQPCCPPAYELPFHNSQESMQSVEEEDPTYSCIKTEDDESDYEGSQPVADFTEICSPVKDISKAKHDQIDVRMPNLHHDRS